MILRMLALLLQQVLLLHTDPPFEYMSHGHIDVSCQVCSICSICSICSMPITNGQQSLVSGVLGLKWCKVLAVIDDFGHGSYTCCKAD